MTNVRLIATPYLMPQILKTYGELDINMIYGSDFVETFAWKTKVNGVTSAVDITNYTFTFTISATKGGTALVTQAGTLSATPTDGTFVVTIDKAVLTTALTADTTYFYKLEDQNGSGTDFFRLAGSIILKTK